MGQKRLDLFRQEPPQLNLLHQSSNDHVAPVVEWKGLPREDEEADIGSLGDDLLQKPQGRHRVGRCLVGVVDDEKRRRTSKVLAEDLDRTVHFASRENGSEARLTQGREEVAKGGEDREVCVPSPHLAPEQISLTPEEFSRLRPKTGFSDSRHALDDEDAWCLALPCNRLQFRTPPNEGCELRRVRQHFDKRWRGGSCHAREVKDSGLCHLSKYVQEGGFATRFGEHAGQARLAHALLIPDADDLRPHLVAQSNGGYFPRIR